MPTAEPVALCRPDDTMIGAHHELPEAPGADGILRLAKDEQDTGRQQCQGIPLCPNATTSLQGAGKEPGIECALQQYNIGTGDKKPKGGSRNDEQDQRTLG